MVEERSGPDEKYDGNPNNKKYSKKAGDGQADQIETAILVTKAMAQNPPAQPGDEANLFGKTWADHQVSHESSSS
jgi:hypothetical protein